MNPRLTTLAALLLANSVAIPSALADHADAASSPDRVAFEDSSRTDTEPAPRLDADEVVAAPAAPRHTPRFQIAVGPYTSTRALSFAVAESTPVDELPETPPESTLAGARVDVAIFPVGGTDRRGRMVGPGITGSYRHSIGATAEYDDVAADEFYTLPVIDTAWSLGVRYRQPLGPALIEVGLSHDSVSHRVDEQPDWLELPDAEYRAVGGSARFELSLRPGAVVSLGGSYQYVLDAGEIMSVDGYGSGSLSAYTVDAGVDVGLGGPVFAAANLGLHQVTMSFVGDGDLSAREDAEVADVYGATDRAVAANVGIGVRY